MNKEQRDFARLKEKLEVLTGERGGAERQALRRAELARLLELPDVTSATVSASPSAAEHNALVADVHALSRALRAIAEGLR